MNSSLLRLFPPPRILARRQGVEILNEWRFLTFFTDGHACVYMEISLNQNVIGFWMVKKNLTLFLRIFHNSEKRTCLGVKSLLNVFFGIVTLNKDFLLYFFLRASFFLFIVEFRSGNAPILIATDVASRGLGKSFYRSYFSAPTMFAFSASL